MEIGMIRRTFISSIVAGSCIFLSAGIAAAQDRPEPAGSNVKADPANSAGNQLQPQGWTGPINTQSGGAPAESPQGQTPPGMQAAPQGSDKQVRTDEGGVPEGASRK